VKGLAARSSVVALGLVLGAVALGAQAPVVDARLENAPGLTPAEAVARSRSDSEPVWIGWRFAAVPATDDVCCTNAYGSRRGCSLAEEPDSWHSSSEGRGENPKELAVLVEHRGGRPTAMRLVSPSCRIDGAGRRLVWLDSVETADSLALLEPMLAPTPDEDLAEQALAAVAHHAGAAAGGILERRVFDRGLDSDAREQAIFWTGELRGDAGVRVLDRVLSEEPDGELREHALFALTLSGLDGALARLRRAAAEDRDPDVRSQGLFWLAQTNAPDAGEWIYRRTLAERDDDVREQGVFALSQLDDGTDWLLRILRSGDAPDLARQALFWLGQSEDPRALAELERLLD